MASSTTNTIGETSLLCCSLRNQTNDASATARNIIAARRLDNVIEYFVEQQLNFMSYNGIPTDNVMDDVDDIGEVISPRLYEHYLHRHNSNNSNHNGRINNTTSIVIVN